MEKYDKNKLLNNKRSIITKEEKIEQAKNNKKKYYIENFEKNRNSKNEKNKQYRLKIKWLKLLPLYIVSKNETHLYF